MFTLLLLILSIFYYYYFYDRTKDILNPLGVFLFLWCVTAFLSTLYLSPLQQVWNVEMKFIVVGSSFAVFLAGYLFVPRFKKKVIVKDVKITSGFIVLTRTLFLISLICVLIEWRFNGYILPGLDFINNPGIDSKSLVKSISGIHYGSILMPYLGVFAYFEMVYSSDRKKIYCVLALFVSIVFYSFMLIISRGTLLSMILGIIFIRHTYEPISIRVLSIVSGLVLAMFVVIAVIRIPEGSMVFTSLESSGRLGEYISPVYTYIAYSFENLFKLVRSPNEYSLLHYSLISIWRPIGLLDSSNFRLYDTIFFNSRTYLYAFYHDLGLVGALVFPFLIGTTISKFYKNIQSKPGYILMVAVLQKAIITTFFGNYFTGEFIIMWPYIITGLVILSLKYNVKIR